MPSATPGAADPRRRLAPEGAGILPAYGLIR